MSARASAAEQQLRQHVLRAVAAAFRQASRRGVPRAWVRWRQNALVDAPLRQRGGVTLARAWHRLKLGRARVARREACSARN